MKVITELDSLLEPPRQTVLTIGNFDGVHLGHREIFRKIVRQAHSIDGTAAVLTFEPHPLRLLAPDKSPPRINTPEEKIRLIEASCIDLMVILPFTRDLAALTAGEFVRQVLVEKLAVRHLVVGYDYAFGRAREGDIDFLRSQADRYGFVLDVLEPICSGDRVYSSTRIRQAVQAGRVAEVVEMLGRNFTLDGTVVHGAGRGRQLGFPTSNLETSKELLPAEGVYAVKVKWQERLYDAVVNIGRRPTFDDLGPALEIHLLDFDGDLYDENLRIYFVERLREEKRFDGIAELQAAVKSDITLARKVLSGSQVVVFHEYLDCGYAQQRQDTLDPD